MRDTTSRLLVNIILIQKQYYLSIKSMCAVLNANSIPFAKCSLNGNEQFAICRPDGVGTVTHEEKDKFQEIKERLRVRLEYQITNFRYIYIVQGGSFKSLSSFSFGWLKFSRSCFPFGRPEGALKATLSLMERVSRSAILATRESLHYTGSHSILCFKFFF